MCLAVIGRIKKVEGDMATAEIMDVQRQISIVLVPEVKVGDYVIIHAGFAINPIDEEEAKKTEELLKEVTKYH